MPEPYFIGAEFEALRLSEDGRRVLVQFGNDMGPISIEIPAGDIRRLASRTEQVVCDYELSLRSSDPRLIAATRGR